MVLVYKCVQQKGLNFEVKSPVSKPVAMGEPTKEELDAELRKGYADMEAGRTVPAEEVFADIRRKYGL